MKARIIIDFPGQTCNRLWSYLDNVAWAIIKNKKLYIIHWDTSISNFDNLRNHKNIKFPFYNKWVITILGEKRIQKLLKVIFNNNLLLKFYNNKQTCHLDFIKGWEYRYSENYYHLIKDEIINTFKPNKNIQNDVLHHFEYYKKNDYFIIGVHIRKGDYKTFAGGKYYYSDDIYIYYMKQLVQLYKNKKTIFFISTNEKYSYSTFKDFNIIKTDFQTDIHDLYALSLCNRIIGPLSTFSRWASFIGEVPLYFIEPNNTKLKDDDFSVITNFYRFKNNKEIENLTINNNDWSYK